MIKKIAAAVALLSAAPSTLAHDYAAGQVWEYHVRPGDEGSLLKIQQVEEEVAIAKAGPIFHISVVGFHLRNPRITPVLPHAPVTKEALDSSVVRRSTASGNFPDAEGGIAEWRSSNGGVFTIPVAQIIQLLDDQTANVEQ